MLWFSRIYGPSWHLAVAGQVRQLPRRSRFPPRYPAQVSVPSSLCGVRRPAFAAFWFDQHDQRYLGGSETSGSLGRWLF